MSKNITKKQEKPVFSLLWRDVLESAWLFNYGAAPSDQPANYCKPSMVFYKK